MPGYAHQAGDAEPALRGPWPPQGAGSREKSPGPRNRPLISTSYSCTVVYRGGHAKQVSQIGHPHMVLQCNTHANTARGCTHTRVPCSRASSSLLVAR
eukprot:3204348-Prymnesium_polylepis.1